MELTKPTNPNQPVKLLENEMSESNAIKPLDEACNALTLARDKIGQAQQGAETYSSKYDDFWCRVDDLYEQVEEFLEGLRK